MTRTTPTLVAFPGDPGIDTVANLSPGDVVHVLLRKHVFRGVHANRSQWEFYPEAVEVDSITDFPHKNCRMVWFTTPWSPTYEERFALLAPDCEVLRPEVTS